MKKYKYTFCYKTTNLVNNKIYIGIHQTDNLNDGYLGSGQRFQLAKKKYGVENFNREILKFFETLEECKKFESSIVTREFIKLKDNYNIAPGGGMPPTRYGEDHHFYGKPHIVARERMLTDLNPSKIHKGTDKHPSKNCVVVKDKDGNKFRVSIKDPRYLSGELNSINKGRITVKDKDGNCFSVDKTDPKYLSGELVQASKGVKKNIKNSTKGKIIVEDSSGNRFKLFKNDPRIIDENLKVYSNFKGKSMIPPNKGIPKTEESKKAQSNKMMGMKMWNNGTVTVRSVECPGEGWVNKMPRKNKI